MTPNNLTDCVVLLYYYDARNSLHLRCSHTSQVCVVEKDDDASLSSCTVTPVMHAARGMFYIHRGISFRCASSPLSIRQINKEPHTNFPTETKCSAPCVEHIMHDRLRT
jgi:hypothetical protein